MNNEMLNDHERLIEKKARFFFNSQTKVHVTLKRNNKWERGWITEPPSGDFLFLKYTPEGASFHKKEGDHYFFLEIQDIEEFTPDGGIE